MDFKKITKNAALVFLLSLLSLSGVHAEAMGPDDLPTTVRKVLQNKGDFLQHKVKRLGNRTMALETFLSSEGDFAVASRVLANFSDYPRWLLPGINNRPAGGMYYLRILQILPHEDQLTFNFLLNLPVFKQEGKRTFRLKSRMETGSLVVNAETLPQEESLIESVVGEMRIFPAVNEPNRIWMHIRGRTQLRSTLVYEALPERMMVRESGDRLQLLVKNYLKEEDRIRNARPITSIKK